MRIYITPDDYKRAEQNGVSAKLLNARIRTQKWDKERAINTPTRKYNTLPDEIKQLATENGISYKLLMNRISKGWDPKRAATQPIRRWEKWEERQVTHR